MVCGRVRRCGAGGRVRRCGGGGRARGGGGGGAGGVCRAEAVVVVVDARGSGGGGGIGGEEEAEAVAHLNRAVEEEADQRRRWKSAPARTPNFDSLTASFAVPRACDEMAKEESENA